MNNEIKLYIYTIRKKILKLYIKIISFNYKNIVSKDDANFFNIYDLSFIDNSYVNVINRLIDVIKLINDTKNNQIGGERKKKQKYSDKENEEIKQLKKKIDELKQRIVIMQKQQIYLNNSNQMMLYKAEMYKSGLLQHHADLTQCKADKEILTNDNSNLKEKILFFDKSLEILSKEIDTNLSNGILHLNTYEDKIDTIPREHKTIVNIELSDKLSDVYKINASSNDGDITVKNKGNNDEGRSNGPKKSVHFRDPEADSSETGSSSDRDIFDGNSSDGSGSKNEFLHQNNRTYKQVNPFSFATLINTQNKK
jgi:hypothetical protein